MADLLMPAWLSTTLGILLALLILLAMITIHEFGHYLAGKILKFRITEFSIGFGPALFKRKSKRTGELFTVRLLPLGGYCAFAGEDGIEEPEKKKDEAPMPEKEEEEDPPFEDFAKSAEAAKPAETADPAHRRERLRYSEDGDFTEMKPWKRIIVLIAGASMNYLLALVLIFLLFGIYGQSFVMVRGAEITEEYGAEVSFHEGDILLGAAGKDFYLTTDIAQALNGKKAGETVSFRVAERREDGSLGEAERQIMLRCDVSVKNSAEVNIAWKALGVGIEKREDASYYMLSSTDYRFGFGETIGRSFLYSFRIAGSIFRVLGELLTGRIGLDAFGGPVTTVTMTSEIAMSGMRNFLSIAAYIGVNLAVFNLLPIPALDGSKVVFTAIEWVRGRPISRKVEAVIHTVGFFLLLGFAVLVDILQFL